MMLYYSVHYPNPEKETLLIDAMRQAGKIIKGLPGNLYDNAFQDASLGTIMAITVWESQEAFQAALPTLQSARQDSPSREWEIKPPEVYMLNSTV